ncbi:hypothetical protein OBA47_01160 [bacterium]|nr:hypothetical protein [bacterium]
MDARQLRTPHLGRDGERWDLLQLSKNGGTHGGQQLRRRIQERLRESDARPEPELLAFRGTSTMTIDARGRELSGSVGCLRSLLGLGL